MPLQIPDNKKKIGPIKVNTPYSFSVQLLNTGISPITNLSIKGFGCQICTSGSLSATSIQPGGSTNLNILYRPKVSGTDIPRPVTVQYTYNGTQSAEVFTFYATSVN